MNKLFDMLMRRQLAGQSGPQPMPQNQPPAPMPVKQLPGMGGARPIDPWGIKPLGGQKTPPAQGPNPMGAKRGPF